jgi:hypothetical protein
MYICYLDESGTPELTGSGTQFVYAGFAIPALTWRDKDIQIQTIKDQHFLTNTEIHTAWISRPYPEQDKIPNFINMSHEERKKNVIYARTINLSRRIANGEAEKKLKALKTNYRKTLPYIHLTFAERKNFLLAIAKCVGNWNDARVFFDAIDKKACDESKLPENGLYETAFHEVVSRFHLFLANKGRYDNKQYIGLVVSDNNQDVEKRITALAKKLHSRGTRWGNIPNIVETPLFVNSETTGMVQIADFVAYAIRRHIEKKENELFSPIFSRIDRAGRSIVGGRHYTWSQPCDCDICRSVRNTFGNIY